MIAPSKGKIIVSGILFFYPLAGVTYQFLHYLIGLRRLGYDAYYVEDSKRWVFSPELNDVVPDAAANVAALAPILEEHGLAGRWALRERYGQGRCFGLTEEQLMQVYSDADALLNVTGAQELYEEHLRIPRRVYVESDPFSAQVQFVNGDPAVKALLQSHNVHFTFGENIGAPDCGIPSTPFAWWPTRQPVLMEFWESGLPPAGRSFRTITSWHNNSKSVTLHGETYYWTKDREFEKFLQLPQLRPSSFELAVTVNSRVRSLLQKQGWKVVDAVEVSRSMPTYRQFIQDSLAEFTVARDQYVRPRTGWFSDRSVCYLAAGRPVITQETGFSKFLPSGQGLFGFGTVEEIVRAVDAIESDYQLHSRAAREIAAEYFAAEKVLSLLMSRAGLS